MHQFELLSNFREIKPYQFLEVFAQLNKALESNLPGQFPIRVVTENIAKSKLFIAQ